jgi:hypothetical protein
MSSLPGASSAGTRLPPNLIAPLGTVPPLPSQEPANLTTFDYHLLELRWVDNRWQLYAGGLLLKDFGIRQYEGREALRILRDLRVNQHGTIGSPKPVLEYWLVDGKAPEAFPAGLRLLPIDRGTLRVEQIQGQWCLRDGQRLLFTFGSHEHEAQKALELIRRHGFSQVGYVGQPVPAMLYFLGNGSAMASSTPPPSAPNSPPADTSQASKAPVQTPLPQPPINPAAQSLSNFHPAGLIPPRQLNVPQVAGLSTAKERVTFDPRQVQVRRDGVEWKLYYGAYALANFGSSDAAPREAHQALSAVQFYRFTEQDLVGEQPGFSYFLSSGKAPKGLLFGVRNQPFRPEMVNVRQSGEHYVLCDEDRPLLNFGDRADDARRVMQAIKHYQFDHLCRVGHEEGKGMMFFVQTR